MKHLGTIIVKNSWEMNSVYNQISGAVLAAILQQYCGEVEYLQSLIWPLLKTGLASGCTNLCIISHMSPVFRDCPGLP